MKDEKVRVIETVRIETVTSDYIEFSNGDRILYDHDQDCCEDNFADFKQIEERALKEEFTLPIDFEVINEKGFRFGNQPYAMYFIPCYSDQNGYYTSDIDIYYAKKILSFMCEERID